jgi:hypothetical protein
MAAQPEPATISWRETLSLLVERGYSEGAAKDTLLRAVVDASVGYYPRRAVSLETQYRKGLLDLETGALRMSHRDDNPWYIRVVASDFERQFPQRRGSSTIGGEKKVLVHHQRLAAWLTSARFAAITQPHRSRSPFRRPAPFQAFARLAFGNF